MTDTRLDKIFYELQGITANQIRILELLSERSKETILKELKPEAITELTTKEEVSMDLVDVLLTKETPKAFLIVKHGFQCWVAKSHLKDPTGYDVGNRYDLEVKDASQWILEKLEWKPFEVVKQ